MLYQARSPREFYISLEGPLHQLRRKVWMATKFTRPQFTWLLRVGCNAAGISQT